MSQFCIACNKKLNLISSSEDDCMNVICDCGVINQAEYTNVVKRQINVALIKNKMREILTEKMFNNLDLQTKNEIETYASKIGTHVTNSLKCFALIFIESRNLVSFDTEFTIKKRQRKNAIQILVSISPNSPTIFVRTPLTYIEKYSNIYTNEEKIIYKDVSECLLFLNACNKKNMQVIYDKIHKVIMESRSHQTELVYNECNLKIDKNPQSLVTIKSSNLLNIIKFLVFSRLTVNDLIEGELLFCKYDIISFK